MWYDEEKQPEARTGRAAIKALSKLRDQYQVITEWDCCFAVHTRIHSVSRGARKSWALTPTFYLSFPLAVKCWQKNRAHRTRALNGPYDK